MRKAVVSACAVVICLGASVSALRFSSVQAADANAGIADKQGNLHVPENYRTHYEYLGTWSVAASGSPGTKEMHIVFASPGAVSAYERTGSFPDGTVLVKEVVEATTAPMTTGTVSRYDQLKGWFVMQKDSKNTHAGNALWGDGWGWSWFDADKPKKTTSTDYKKDCLTCHIPAKDTDWIYIQGYPTLKH
jgi:cytochrome P460